MNLLVLAGAYPHPGHPFSGAFNEKCSLALKNYCDVLEVFSPRPFVPPFLSFDPRWNTYRHIPSFEVRQGIPVSRPAVPVVPRVGSAFWLDSCAYFFMRAGARKQHRRVGFDAIMSFDLVETGGIAWRLSRDLGIPASGWAFGDDMRHPKSSPFAAVARRAIRNLGCVFYQSQELLQRGMDLLDDKLTPEMARRHSVLSHGIPRPPALAREEVRSRIRAELGIGDKEILVINISRVTRPKGIFELIDSFALAVATNPLMRCVWVGAKPGFDESREVAERIQSNPGLQGKFRLLPACGPDKVWEYLCGADIFAFPSHREGMSNSLLEAMAMEVPAVAFAIPPNSEIDSGAGVLCLVPPLDTGAFAQRLTDLSFSAATRIRLGRSGATLVRDRFQADRNMEHALEKLAGIVSDAKQTGLQSAALP